MANKQRETVLCQICKEAKKLNRVVPAELVREPLAEMIRKSHPDWSTDGFICLPDLNRFRAQFVKDVLEKDKGELTALDQQVVTSLKEHELLSKNVNIEFDRRLTLGEKLSDRLADFGGSWGFILGFAAVIVVWIAINSFALLHRTFDPYPFILLNLVLSCLAAVQAPIIMMSQNRQEAKDRLRAEHDYRVNLKAELEIRHLHEKIDHLLMNQWQRLLEIQEIQTELMEELTRKSPRGRTD
jgi:uncharacterized membrane protein